MSKLDEFYELSGGCPMYEPCPICYKCQVKATHLYEQCASCPLEFCGHNNKQRTFMIRRENFAIKVNKDTMAQLIAMADRAKEKHQHEKDSKTL